MAGNNNIVNLDFASLKDSLKTFLQSQDVLKDYNYEGSALSVLLDVLALNTQYQGYYLNQVANEMFLDTALQRDSVVSHAKLLGYTPKSAIAPAAVVNVNVYGVTTSSLTLPKFTKFLSEAIDGVNYTFVTVDDHTVNTANNTAAFSNITLKQGIPSSTSYTVDSTTNPKYIFDIPDTNVDTTTLQVVVQNSSTNTVQQVYTQAADYANIKGTDTVYFLQEGLGGVFQIYFGDNILGKQLSDGNIVKVSYITTDGTNAAGSNNFVLMDSIGGFSNTSITPIYSASQGGDKESIDSIKFHAPRSYSAQGRAVTKQDYKTAIQNNTLGISFDAVNVWGGEDNNPPVYGQVFVSLKPAGAYNLTQTQKQRLTLDVLKPISMMTVEPIIVEPDYTYIQITSNVMYDPLKTTLTALQIQASVKAAIQAFANATLNTFNSVFDELGFYNAIRNAEPSIVANEVVIKVQKKFFPNLTSPTTYSFDFDTPLNKGTLLSGINTFPSYQIKDPTNPANVIDGIYIEEIPSSTSAIESISIINPGFSYTSAPKVTIIGDGSGATAVAILSNSGSVQSIQVVTGGTGYTSATVVITPVIGDTTGQQAAAIANLSGRYGTLQSYYNNINNVKTILNSSIGTVDYTNGIITLNSFNPLQVNNPLGQLTVSANPTTTLLQSSLNKILTVDPYDPNAIVVNVVAKTK